MYHRRVPGKDMHGYPVYKEVRVCRQIILWRRRGGPAKLQLAVTEGKEALGRLKPPQAKIAPLAAWTPEWSIE